MSEEIMNTKEVAEYLGIHEKQVYALIKAGKIPSTRVTGKWIFPRNLIDEWILTNAEESVTKGGGKCARDGDSGSLLASGSNDPVLDILLSYMKKSYSGCIFTCNTGSVNGLMQLKDHCVDIAWCHLFDQETGEYNLSYLSDYLNGRKIAVIHLFYRELGFVYDKASLGEINQFSDLTREDVSFINRQPGAGTRVLLDHNLKKYGVDSDKIRGYDREVYTHIEVGFSVSSGESNAGIATGAISNLFGLGFQPVVKESFDMVLSQETFFEKGVQAFIETLKTESFREKVSPLGYYDFSESGKIISTEVS